MALDPQVATHLQRLAATGFASMHTLQPGQVREGMRRMAQALSPGKPVRQIDNRTISTDAGDLQVRIYHPDVQGGRPVMVFFHGGGFVLGDLDTHDGLARSLALATDCIVVSVDYPLSPENKYPAARNAAYAATQWVSQHASELGGDPSQLVVAGDSAGGNLAAVVALMARNSGGPEICFQLLIYPDLDFRRSNGSIQAFAGQYGNVSRETQDWFMDHYLNGEEEKLEPLVSPLLAEDHADLPPALVVTAEYDALRDEGEAYGHKLQRAGVDTVVMRCEGMIHEFLRWPFDASHRALQEIGHAVRGVLRRRGAVGVHDAKLNFE
ncbi:alpha/beta hydrolase [Variovorax sp. J22P240]|uniref:alpha/beta hydrolase n=1 Tax=Variovorax sp. J22P240 TaxID=3053514 RepID=UPI002574FF26|nr:alpha/beta hydrolase [Variovorax sp. J22P240]MDM0002584.1 alpha/beta hydrolase [Variovorax sp. J22P240]